ncbi:MAG: ATPase [Clostridia bacterium]|nr:ATPase [Clostridia bacterium]
MESRFEVELTLEEVTDLPGESYVLIDTRDEASFEYDTMPGAVHVPELMEKARSHALDKAWEDKKLVLFCMRGFESRDMAETLRELGYRAYSLRDGFAGFIRSSLEREDRSEAIEKSLRSRHFHETLFSPFARAVRDYALVNEGDRIAVCISGGKDSMLMAKLFQELERCRKVNFSLKFLVMDPGYNELNRLVIEKNARQMGIPITIFESPIFDTVDNLGSRACYTCARMRRGYLYKEAQSLGCNKIALGHHFDDVIETILMGMLWGGQFQTMMPKLHAEHWEGMELIRPMYYVRESDIRAWRDSQGLHFIQCACHFTDTCSSCRDDGVPVSKRMETKLLIRKLRETNPAVESNIFHASECVNLATVLGYRQDGEKHSFLQDYDGPQGRNA